MINQLTQALALGAVLTVPIAATADTFTGKLNGFNCASHGESCPVSKLDPHLRFEPDFVLMQPNGNYLILPNVGRDVKVRHVLEDIKVTGSQDPKFNVVKVDELYAKSGGDYRLVWSQKIEDEQLEELYRSGNFAHRERY